MLSAIVLASVSIFLAVSLLFIYALRIRNNGILDVFWGIGFILVACLTLIFTSNYSVASLLTLTFISVWGVRLALHIHHRNHNKPEDARYQAFREQWKDNFILKSFVQLFLLQGLLLLIISLAPMATIVYRSGPLTVIDGLGLMIWIVGFYFEAVADWQLKEFKRNPTNKGRIMRGGLWRYTRHPNYFGEAVMWWGIWLLSLPTPIGLLTIISPITITFLLMKVSGVPILESKYANNPDYQSYKQSTPAFFPKFW